MNTLHRQHDPYLGKKNLITYDNAKVDKAMIKSVVPEHVQQCLEGMGIYFSSNNEFKTHQ